MRRLSSNWTVFWKFVFPSLWVGMFALGTLIMYVAPDIFEGDGDIREMRRGFLIATLLVTAFAYWACIRLKKVVLDNDDLIVSNYLQEQRIALKDIEEVSGSILVNPELVWLRFRKVTTFGQKIMFMPKMRFSFGLTRHPLVKELNALITGVKSK